MKTIDRQNMSGNNALASRASPATVVVLCGGKGSRLHGVDKPLLEVDHVPIIEHICRALQGIGPVLISANRNAAQYQRYGAVIADQAADQGPLAGLAACLHHCRTETVLVVPGDCPDYSQGLAEKLLNALEHTTQPIDAICAADGSRQQHLHLALKSSVLGSLENYLQLGGRSVQGWLKELRLAVVDCSEFAAGFTDIDDPQDLARRQP